MVSTLGKARSEAMQTGLSVLSRFVTRDQRDTVERVVRFLRLQTESARARMLVVGMSGGLDSSVTAALASFAVGGKNVLGIGMPESETYDKKELDDARSVAKEFRTRFEVVDISGVLATIRDLVKPGKAKLVAWGNVKARLRAAILYYYANVNNGLVVGTGDKSELMLGYFTKYGDGASDIMPLGDIFKTSLQALGKHIGLSSRILSKKPSPNLWPGQTAERELGLGYDRIDPVLSGLERWVPPIEIAREVSVPLSVVLEIRARWLGTEHKRRLPLVPKLGFRTVGMDFRLPYNREG